MRKPVGCTCHFRLSRLTPILPFFIVLSFTAHADDALQQQVLEQLASSPDKHFSFRQEKKLAVLQQPLITEGELHIDPAHKITWDIRKPYVLRYELTPEYIREIGAEGEKLLKPGQNPIAAALTQTMAATLSGNWTDSHAQAHLQAEGSIAHWQLTITPTADALKPLITLIHVQGAAEYIERILITETNGDSTAIQLSVLPP